MSISPLAKDPIYSTISGVVIMCRVSSTKQARDGHGLDGQEAACRKWCEQRNLTVIKVIKEAGVSGASKTRDGHEELFEFLKRNKNMLVLYYDVSRIARDVQTHVMIINRIGELGAMAQTVTAQIEDTPAGDLVINLLASVAQFQRRQLIENVHSKMKARMEAGFWQFSAPSGYKYFEDPLLGKVLRASEPQCELIKEALTGYSTGRFIDQVAIQHFLEAHQFRYHSQSSKVHLSHVKRILSRSAFYAGWLEYPDWNVTRRKGQHEPLIDDSTHQLVQARLHGASKKGYLRKDAHPDFPLRGLVRCSACEQPLTASWSTGKSGSKYPYYRCKNAACRLQNKNIRCEKLHDDFEELLGRITPDERVLLLVKRVCEDLWNSKSQTLHTEIKNSQKNIQNLDNKISLATERLLMNTKPEINKALEDSITTASLQKDEVERRIASLKVSTNGFETFLEKVFRIVEKPVDAWKLGSRSHRLVVLTVVFSQPLKYSYENKFETPKISPLLEIIDEASHSQKDLVTPRGVEPRFPG